MAEQNLQHLYSWINEDLFKRVLIQDHPNCDITIEKYSIETAIPSGVNFTSQLLRAHVTYNIINDKSSTIYIKKVFETKFVIKAALTNETAKDGFESMRLFEREIITFQHIIPEVCKLIQKFDENKNVSIAPRCYEANLENSYMIFEDLTLQNYCNADDTKGLSMHHFKLMFTKLARWHAATMFLQPLVRTHWQ